MLSPFCVQFKQAKNNKHKADLHYHKKKKKHFQKEVFFFLFVGFIPALGMKGKDPTLHSLKTFLSCSSVMWK